MGQVIKIENSAINSHNTVDDSIIKYINQYYDNKNKVKKADKKEGRTFIPEDKRWQLQVERIRNSRKTKPPGFLSKETNSLTIIHHINPDFKGNARFF